jgi:hypothetical protein
VAILSPPLVANQKGCSKEQPFHAFVILQQLLFLLSQGNGVLEDLQAFVNFLLSDTKGRRHTDHRFSAA